jgi:hypothetical protein
MISYHFLVVTTQIFMAQHQLMFIRIMGSTGTNIS